MATYYLCLLNDTNTSISSESTETWLNELKDWLRFSRGSYLLYTNLAPGAIRDKLREIHGDAKPDVLVVKLDKTKWSAFAGEVTRTWMHRERTDELEGQ